MLKLRYPQATACREWSERSWNPRGAGARSLSVAAARPLSGPSLPYSSARTRTLASHRSAAGLSHIRRFPATRTDRCAARGRAHATLGRSSFTRGLAKATTLASSRSTSVEPDRHRPPAVAGRDGVVVVPAAAAALVPDPVVTFLTNEVTEASSRDQKDTGVTDPRDAARRRPCERGLGEGGPEMARGSRTPGCRPARPAGCPAVARRRRRRCPRRGRRR